MWWCNSFDGCNNNISGCLTTYPMWWCLFWDNIPVHEETSTQAHTDMDVLSMSLPLSDCCGAVASDRSVHDLLAQIAT